jgi:hypothetical protein
MRFLSFDCDGKYRQEERRRGLTDGMVKGSAETALDVLGDLPGAKDCALIPFPSRL